MCSDRAWQVRALSQGDSQQALSVEDVALGGSKWTAGYLYVWFGCASFSKSVIAVLGMVFHNRRCYLVMILMVKLPSVSRIFCPWPGQASQSWWRRPLWAARGGSGRVCVCACKVCEVNWWVNPKASWFVLFGKMKTPNRCFCWGSTWNYCLS